MAPTILILLVTSLFTQSLAHNLQSDFTANNQSFMSIQISQLGLDFLKDLLVTKAISSMTPLQLPTIQQDARVPFLGGVHVVLSNITIYHIDVPSSFVQLGDDGVVIIASGTYCNLSMDWYYSYSTWVLPVEIWDRGHASVQVEGMEIGLTLGLENQEGTLKLSLMNCGCYVKDISIKLDGGASWFYQGMINAFEEQIGSAVESAITKKLKEGILKLDSVLQDLPKEIPVDDNASLNVTFVDDPLLSNSSIGFEINGLFTAGKMVPITEHQNKNLQAVVSCQDAPKMLGISLDEVVFNSASVLYYDAEFMQWIVDKETVPDQSLLNTAGWRFIVPQLYRKYPKDDLNMNISLSSPPVIRISEHKIDATIYADLIIDVLEADKIIPVVCISLKYHGTLEHVDEYLSYHISEFVMTHCINIVKVKKSSLDATVLVIHGSGSVKILSNNNLAGSVKLDDFTMSLKWSEIGNLHMSLIQPVIWTLIQTVFVPFANSHLGKGFPLPIIHGFTLQNAEIILSNSRITVCSDVSYSESQNLTRSMFHIR